MQLRVGGYNRIGRSLRVGGAPRTASASPPTPGSSIHTRGQYRAHERKGKRGEERERKRDRKRGRERRGGGEGESRRAKERRHGHIEKAAREKEREQAKTKTKTKTKTGRQRERDNARERERAARTCWRISSSCFSFSISSCIPSYFPCGRYTPFACTTPAVSV
eukprot:1979747-Rhodomonas_salina.1